MKLQPELVALLETNPSGNPFAVFAHAGEGKVSLIFAGNDLRTIEAEPITDAKLGDKVYFSADGELIGVTAAEPVKAASASPVTGCARGYERNC